MSDPIPRSVRDKILADYKAGEMTQVAIAKKHKVAPASIYRIITAAGVKRDLTRIPSAAIEAAIEDYTSGDESTASVARRHDLSADTLQKHLRERGLNRPSASQSNGLRDAVVDDYAAGLTSGEVAKKHGVSASTVVAWSRAAGIEIRSPGQPAGGDEVVAYEGKWMLVGGVRRPTHPAPRMVARIGQVHSPEGAPTWDNGRTTENGPGPAASTAGSSQGLTDADRSAS